MSSRTKPRFGLTPRPPREHPRLGPAHDLIGPGICRPRPARAGRTTRAVSTLWTRFDAFGTGRGLLADWHAAFGRDFDRVKCWLKPTGQRAQSHPCLRQPPCGCRHHVRWSRAGPIGVCSCGDGECEAFPLVPDQILIYGLDRLRLHGSLRKALALDPADQVPGANPEPTPPVGLYAALQAPVYLASPESDAELLRDIQRLRIQRPGPFILLTPTRRFHSPETESALERAGGLGLTLAGLVELQPGGDLRLTQPLEPLLAPWRSRLAARGEIETVLHRLQREIAAARREFGHPPAPVQPLPDEDALRLFALVRELEDTGGARKAPLLQVFRLYCLEGLPAEGVAKRCGCSKALIIQRLHQLRRKLGRNPAELRPFASQFEAIEASVSDPRARSLDRHRVLYGD